MKQLLLISGVCICLSNISAQNMAKGKVISQKFLAASIQGNHAGEDPMRRVTIYLPPGYAESKQRYPVIYFLHAFPFDDSIYMAELQLQNLLDEAIGSGQVRPMILVIPNNYTHFKGSLYTNSSLTGRWSDFVAKDVVQYIDKNFRTIPDRLSRGLGGHSMGGHGALKIGMLYSDVFGAVYSMSPGGLNWGPALNIGNVAFKKLQLAKNETEIFNRFDTLASELDFYPFLFALFARTFAPNEQNPPFYGDFPVHYIGDSMVVNVNILKKWEENFPYNMIDAHVPDLKRLTALKLEWGRNDDLPFIPVTCIQFSKKLEALGIDHIAEEYFGDHSNRIGGINGRIYSEVFPFFNSYLNFEDPIKVSARKK